MLRAAERAVRLAMPLPVLQWWKESREHLHPRNHAELIHFVKHINDYIPMPFGPFSLQWRASSPNPPPPPTGPDALCSIDRVTTKSASLWHKTNPRFLILAGEHDVLCTPAILHDAAGRYRDAFRYCVKVGKLDGISEHDLQGNSGKDGDDGMQFKLARGLDHHLQNHVEWERGVEEILAWAEEL